MMKKLAKMMTASTAVLIAFLFSLCQAAAYLTPDEISVSSDSDFFCCRFPLSLKYEGTSPAAQTGQNHSSSKADIMLFGTVPVKEIEVKNSERKNVILGGEPFGIRLYTDGLVVTQISDIPTGSGKRNPALESGIACGDIITAVNHQTLRTNEQLLNAVENSNGESIRIDGIHEGNSYSTYITPVKDTAQNSYKIGLWVRDSCAGLGTVTFIDPENHLFAGLGHGICDSQSGSIMPLLKGDIVPAEISSVKKSTCGFPGTLLGSFSGNQTIGELYANSEYGLYGKTADHYEYDPELLIPVAFRQEIVRGPAQICSTISGSKPEYYNIEIEEISYNQGNHSKNMVIKITDETLLKKTGGIVQGMSGSPIIQNHKLVGAVTHVFVNDPTHGYAIFAENMNEYEKSINKS